jgi:hypothetical protein
MMCPYCFGTGWKSYLPCDVCESRGVVYCCEGEECSNDPPVPVHASFDISDVKRPHTNDLECWCGPILIEDGEILHWNVV